MNRRPAVAGRFYPADPGACRREVEELLAAATAQPAIGAIAPHAGWIYSGPGAALSIKAVAAGNPETVVIFGAVHTRDRNTASIFARGAWDTPLGSLEIDEDLAARLMGSPLVVDDAEAHRDEHSIEVQTPLLRVVAPQCRIVPISVQPSPRAADVGRHCAAVALASGRSVGFLASTDLTHYGPAFGFESHGRGATGIRWAKEVNDRRFIALIHGMQADALVSEASAHYNACGSGAVAAVVAAMTELGATQYVELLHTSSFEVSAGFDPDPRNSVGYEAGIFVRPA